MVNQDLHSSNDRQDLIEIVAGQRLSIVPALGLTWNGIHVGGVYEVAAFDAKPRLPVHCPLVEAELEEGDLAEDDVPEVEDPITATSLVH